MNMLRRDFRVLWDRRCPIPKQISQDVEEESIVSKNEHKHEKMAPFAGNEVDKVENSAEDCVQVVSNIIGDNRE